ncbi:TPA: hypothetical protein MC744_004734, partial [Klebsiella pneumoniae]|nr:hypothetical protein [Klebsiella pneumoniae]
NGKDEKGRGNFPGARAGIKDLINHIALKPLSFLMVLIQIFPRYRLMFVFLQHCYSPLLAASARYSSAGYVLLTSTSFFMLGSGGGVGLLEQAANSSPISAIAVYLKKCTIFVTPFESITKK